MACGVPCVARDVGDSALLMGETAQIVPPKNPQALSDDWQHIIELGELGRGKLGVSARRRIAEHFSLSDIVARYEAFYLESIGNVRNCRI
jgi:glycosyltransferase involved in cell wall biosynthesis